MKEKTERKVAGAIPKFLFFVLPVFFSAVALIRMRLFFDLEFLFFFEALWARIGFEVEKKGKGGKNCTAEQQRATATGTCLGRALLFFPLAFVGP